MKAILFAAMACLLPSCAVLHHVQIGDIDSRQGYKREAIDIKVSENGVNLKELEAISRSFNSKSGDQANDALAFVQLFQMGPRTGNPVYDPSYARNLREMIEAACPNGNVSHLRMVRENRKYPVVSGEIVKVEGYCLVKDQNR